MRDEIRRKKQADALLADAPEIDGRKIDLRSVGRLLRLERLGNKFFGGKKEQGDIEAMTEVLYVATRTRDELAGITDEDVADFADGISLAEINEFGKYFESVLGEIDASAAEPAKSPGKNQAENGPTGQPPQ